MPSMSPLPGGGSPRRGMDRSCQEELEMRKGRLDIQPLYLMYSSTS